LLGSNVASQQELGIEWHDSAPGGPMQSGFVESFNGRLRVAGSQREPVVNLSEAGQIIEEWRIARNTDRPHTSFNGSHRPSLQPRTTGAKPRADDRGFCWHPLGLNGRAARKIFKRRLCLGGLNCLP